MQNIIEILKANGIDVSEEQESAINKAVSENYKTINEFTKKLEKAEQERDNFKKQYEDASETLKSFDGVNVEDLQGQIDTWKGKAEEAEKDFNAKIAERDFADALRTEMETVKFSSEYAKKSVMEEIKAAGLKLVDGKIMGLQDMLNAIKEKDASAFMEDGESRPRFTNRTTQKPSGKVTPSELMRMKNENPDLDISQYLGKDE